MSEGGPAPVRPKRNPWLAVCALLAAGSLAGGWLPAAALDWQPGLALAEPWRFFSAAFVHWSDWHLAANGAALAVVAALGAAARLPAAAAAAWVAAWPLTHAGLLLQPALARYGGASGVLHAAVAVAAVWLVAGGLDGGDRGGGERGDSDRRARWIGGAIAAGLVAKVLLERPWAQVLVAAPAWSISVAPLAHASGAAAGLGCALVALGLGGRGGHPR